MADYLVGLVARFSLAAESLFDPEKVVVVVGGGRDWLLGVEVVVHVFTVAWYDSGGGSGVEDGTNEIHFEFCGNYFGIFGIGLL